MKISIPLDEDGFLGRECPESDCEGYFKIKPGTGLKGAELPCHCPYCGHTDPHDHFWTKEQIEYARSVALRQISDAVRADLKSLEFDVKPKGAFGIGVSMKLQPGRAIPIRYYREKALETHASCDNCTLEYAVYGVFGFCPDCREHNSLTILALIDRYQAAAGARDAARRAHVGANADLKAVADELLGLVHLLDVLNGIRYRGNPELRAAWKSARDVAWRRTGGQAGSRTVGVMPVLQLEESSGPAADRLADLPTGRPADRPPDRSGESAA